MAARATLHRAAAFLPDGIGLPERAVLGRGTARVIANSLRELDRFLNLLIDETARKHGHPVAPNQHNTANKLRSFRAALGQPDGDYLRLRALGRTRDCLFHVGGRVTRGDMPGISMMTMGWRVGRGDHGLKRHRIGEIVRVTSAELADVGRFYANLATTLVPEPVVSPPARIITASVQPTISSGAKK